MDPATISALLSDAAKISFVVFLLLVAVLGLVAWVKGLERERKEREEKRDRETKERETLERERCQREVGQAVARINFLEERAHQESHGMLVKCLETMQTCAAAINGMVELEKSKQTASGPHPTIGGNNAS